MLTSTQQDEGWVSGISTGSFLHNWSLGGWGLQIQFVCFYKALWFLQLRHLALLQAS